MKKLWRKQHLDHQPFSAVGNKRRRRRVSAKAFYKALRNA